MKTDLPLFIVASKDERQLSNPILKPEGQFTVRDLEAEARISGVRNEQFGIQKPLIEKPVQDWSMSPTDSKCTEKMSTLFEKVCFHIHLNLSGRWVLEKKEIQ